MEEVVSENVEPKLRIILKLIRVVILWRKLQTKIIILNNNWVYIQESSNRSLLRQIPCQKIMFRVQWIKILKQKKEPKFKSPIKKFLIGHQKNVLRPLKTCLLLIGIWRILRALNNPLVRFLGYLTNTFIE